MVFLLYCIVWKIKFIEIWCLVPVPSLSHEGLIFEMAVLALGSMNNTFLVGIDPNPILNERRNPSRLEFEPCDCP